MLGAIHGLGWCRSAAVAARLVGLVAVMAFLLPANPSVMASPPAEPPALILGTTFSPRQATYLGLSTEESFAASTDLGFPLVRLGAYWNEIEANQGEYDFSSLDWLIDHAREHETGVILTVGMKAPRWPEFFLPDWVDTRAFGDGDAVGGSPVRESLLAFVQAVVERYRDQVAVRYWQVENEPFDPAGPRDWQIDRALFVEEVGLVRALDPDRPIIGTAFVQGHWLLDLRYRLLGHDRAGYDLLDHVDILGLDVYPTVAGRFLGFPVYLHASESLLRRKLESYCEAATARDREVWVTEAQAEPWEPGLVVDTRRANPPSQKPGAMRRTVALIQSAGIHTIFLWGVEHWYMRLEQHDDAAWWRNAEHLLKRDGV